jgi:hypothetical protein
VVRSLIGLFAFLGTILACSSPQVPQQLRLRVTDMANQPIHFLKAGAQTPVRIWVIDPNAISIDEVEIDVEVGECLAVESPSLRLTAEGHGRENNELVQSLELGVEKQCPPGFQAPLKLHAYSLADPIFTQGQWMRHFTITSAEPEAQLELRNFRINQRPRRSVFAGEEIKISLDLSNAGEKAAEAIELQIDLGTLESSEQHWRVQIENSLDVSEHMQLQWPGSIKIPAEARAGEEYKVEFKWLANDGSSAGKWIIPLQVASPPYADRIQVNGRVGAEFKADEPIEVLFELVNPSGIDLGPGRIHVLETRFASVLENRNELRFSDLSSLGRTQLTGTALKIMPEVSSANGLIIRMQWQSLFGYTGNFDLNLRTKEAQR